MTEPGGRRVAIGIDESDFAEQAFDCKFELYFFDCYILCFALFNAGYSMNTAQSLYKSIKL